MTRGDLKRRLPGLAQWVTLGFLNLTLISITPVWLVRRAQIESDLVARSLQVENGLSDLLLSLRRAERAQRGYLLTEDRRQLGLFFSVIQVPEGAS
jgi:CHASE3 domain sensor protein